LGWLWIFTPWFACVPVGSVGACACACAVGSASGRGQPMADVVPMWQRGVELGAM